MNLIAVLNWYCGQHLAVHVKREQFCRDYRVWPGTGHFVIDTMPGRTSRTSPPTYHRQRTLH
jgi:hypothetical protein